RDRGRRGPDDRAARPGGGGRAGGAGDRARPAEGPEALARLPPAGADGLTRDQGSATLLLSSVISALGRATRTRAAPAGRVSFTTAVFGSRSRGAFSGGVAALASTFPAASSMVSVPAGASVAPRLWTVTVSERPERLRSSGPMPRSGRVSMRGAAETRS